MERGRIFTVILFIIIIVLAFFNNYISVNSDIEVDNKVIVFSEHNELF
ncbi:hypothetical protein [Orenia metallireducens]|jgi:hypothetical protein|nr:hypothetical protein [Orenia metallireducens]